MCPYSYLSNKALLDGITECSHYPLAFNVEYRPFRLNSSLPDDFPVDRKLYFRQKYGDKYDVACEVSQRLAHSMGIKM
jgi:hypothetical protein